MGTQQTGRGTRAEFQPAEKGRSERRPLDEEVESGRRRSVRSSSTVASMAGAHYCKAIDDSQIGCSY